MGEIAEEQKETKVVTTDKFIEQALSKYDVNLEKIEAFRKECELLTIEGIDDKAGYELVKEAKNKAVKMRTGTAKTQKDLKEISKKYNSAVDDYAKKIIGKVQTDLETPLNNLLAKIDKEKELAKIAEQQRLAKLHQLRRNYLHELGFAFNGSIYSLVDATDARNTLLISENDITSYDEKKWAETEVKAKEIAEIITTKTAARDKEIADTKAENEALKARLAALEKAAEPPAPVVEEKAPEVIKEEPVVSTVVKAVEQPAKGNITTIPHPKTQTAEVKTEPAATVTAKPVQQPAAAEAPAKSESTVSRVRTDEFINGFDYCRLQIMQRLNKEEPISRGELKSFIINLKHE